MSTSTEATMGGCDPSAFGVRAHRSHTLVAEWRAAIGAVDFDRTVLVAAQLHGLAVTELEDFLASAAATPTAGTVVAASEEVKESAQRYAALTGRDPHRVCMLDDLPAGVHPAVVVTLSRSVSARTFRRLYDHDADAGAGAAAGLLIASNVEELNRVLLKSAASVACAGLLEAKQLAMIYADHDFPAIHRGPHSFLSGTSAKADVLEAVSTGVPIVAVFTHNTDFDLRLSPTLQLCPYPPGAAPRPDPLPPCLQSDRCTRLAGLPARGQAWRDQRIVGFPMLKAGVLVVHSCSVVRTGKPTFIAAASNLGNFLSADASYGACITTWKQELAPGDGSSLNTLLNDVASGQAVGCALAQFNRSDVAKASGARLCLLGDPLYRLRASPPAATLRPPTRLERRGQRAVPHTGWLVEIAQRKHLINQQGSLSALISLEVASANTVLDELLIEAARGTVGEDRLRTVRLESNDHAARISALCESAEAHVLSFCSFAGTSNDASCGICGEPAYMYRHEACTAQASEWLMTLCPTCGTDRAGPPSSPDLKILRRGKNWILSLTHYPAEARAAVRVFEVGYSFLNRRLEANKTWFAWPVEANGDIAREFALPESGFSSPARCRVSLAWSAGQSVCATELC